MPEWLALLLSIAIEAVVAAAMIEMLRWGSGRQAALAATLGTLATHPLAWNGMILLMEQLDYGPAFLCVEAAVVLAESLAYMLCARQPVGRALLLSLVANGASSGFGLALYGLGLG
jgi:hypothetical protein